MAQKFDTVDEYVAAQPAPSRRILDEVRRRVGASVPDAVEAISYQIPTFKVGGKAVLYVAAWKEHIAVYPIPDTDEQLATEIERYRSGKGTLKFPLDEPFPFELVDRLMSAAVAQRSPA
jgi:uncharacterized protein YdhG (YjbR/CyaY superfamily)